MSDEDNKGNKDILLRQFHEQFAINYNAIAAYIISFIIVVITVFASYYKITEQIIDCICTCDILTIETLAYKLLYVSIIVLVALLIIIYFSLKFGLTIRRDQFIVYKIRRMEWDETGYNDIFTKRYHPFNKKNTNFLVGVFNYIYWISISIAILVFICSLIFLIILYNRESYLILSGCCHCVYKNIICCAMPLKFIILALLGIIDAIFIVMFTKCTYCKYKKYEDYYDSIKPKS